MARLKLDENLPVDLADLLRGSGHDAATVHEEQLAGKPDSTIASVCKAEQRGILTLDLGFADIRSYPPGDYAGIIVLRLTQQDVNHIAAEVRRLLPALDQEEVVGKLWIADETTLRIRS